MRPEKSIEYEGVHEVFCSTGLGVLNPEGVSGVI